MAKSKGKLFGHQHCWDLLENYEKWKLINNSGSPKTREGTHSSPGLVDGEDDDADGEEREKFPRNPTMAASMSRSDGRKRGNAMLRKMERWRQ